MRGRRSSAIQQPLTEQRVPDLASVRVELDMLEDEMNMTFIKDKEGSGEGSGDEGSDEEGSGDNKETL